MFDEEDTAGLRPAPLSEVAGPQERVLRRVVEQIDEFVREVQILGAPCAAGCGQLQHHRRNLAANPGADWWLRRRAAYRGAQAPNSDPNHSVHVVYCWKLGSDVTQLTPP